MRLKLPPDFKIGKDSRIENTFYFYKISNILEKSASYTSLKSLLEDCISYNKRLEELKTLELKPNFTIRVYIEDSVSNLFYKNERIASNTSLIELKNIADQSEPIYNQIDRLNNGEEIEL